MTQGPLPFQYQSEKTTSGLTGFAGLPLYLELAIKSGLTPSIRPLLDTKTQGWSDAEIILSLVLINLAGGDAISDIERLERDAGLKALLLRFVAHGMIPKQKRAYEKRWRRARERGLPSNAAIHRYLRRFHSFEEEEERKPHGAFIPAQNAQLKSLVELNTPLIEYAQRQMPSIQATLDQDATLIQTHKHDALYCYKKYKAYQPLNTYWAEHGMIVHSEFRDGNVPAGFEQLRVLKEALHRLPGDVTKVFLRSDSAGYQEELLHYCASGEDKRFSVIEFAIAAKVSAGFKKAVQELTSKQWHPLYKDEPDGSRTRTTQEWAEVCFVPDWVAKSKKQSTYRYLAIREIMQSAKSGQESGAALPFQTIQDKGITYKLFGVVTNRDLEGNTLIQWHRGRCGKSEQVHGIQKEGLAGGQLPSNLFGVNAAWWQIMILAFNLNRLMQVVALPTNLRERHMKALRFHAIQLPGRVVRHARQLYVQIEKEAYALLASIRERITRLPTVHGMPLLADTS